MEKQYNSLREKIAAEKQERAKLYENFAQLLARANREGYAKAEMITPPEMCVHDPATGKVYHVSEGACGFAWVTVKPANSSFGRWLIKNGHARKGYYGGAEIWISAHGQSMARKETHAYAMAQAFREAGFAAFSGSRMD